MYFGTSARLVAATASVVFLLSSVMTQGQVVDEGRVLGIHGAGTTNPSKCYWNILEKFETRTRLPMKNSYRAVGSGTGIQEFYNELDASGPPMIDFSSGDIPIPTETYEEMKNAGIEVMHFPILLSAVSVFHSIPDTPDLNLTGCILAKIYTREITQWSDPEILERNPNLVIKPEYENIGVGRRQLGSSSTGSFTEYLHNACPEVFPSSLVGSLPEWPAEGYTICEGSGGMTDCILETPGFIGYIDAGHGHAVGLQEIELENKAGTVLNSEQALDIGGVAADRNVLPASILDDFGSVSLVNGAGANTWPITLMTYLYVRRNITYIPNPEEQALLVAFLKALTDPAYIGECAEKYDFILPTQEIFDFAKTGIDILESELPANTTPWVFETDTMAMDGAKDYVISVKRETIGDIEREELQLDVAALQEQLLELTAKLESYGYAIDPNSTLSQSTSAAIEQYLNENVATRDTQLMAALVLACISFAFWIIYLGMALCRMANGGGKDVTSKHHDTTGVNGGATGGANDTFDA